MHHSRRIRRVGQSVDFSKGGEVLVPTPNLSRKNPKLVHSAATTSQGKKHLCQHSGKTIGSLDFEAKWAINGTWWNIIGVPTPSAKGMWKIIFDDGEPEGQHEEAEVFPCMLRVLSYQPTVEDCEYRRIKPGLKVVAFLQHPEPDMRAGLKIDPNWNERRGWYDATVLEFHFDHGSGCHCFVLVQCEEETESSEAPKERAKWPPEKIFLWEKRLWVCMIPTVDIVTILELNSSGEWPEGEPAAYLPWERGMKRRHDAETAEEVGEGEGFSSGEKSGCPQSPAEDLVILEKRWIDLEQQDLTLARIDHPQEEGLVSQPIQCMPSVPNPLQIDHNQSVQETFNKGSGLVDVDELAAEIEQMLEEEEARETFSVDAFAAELEKVLEQEDEASEEPGNRIHNSPAVSEAGVTIPDASVGKPEDFAVRDVESDSALCNGEMIEKDADVEFNREWKFLGCTVKLRDVPPRVQRWDKEEQRDKDTTKCQNDERLTHDSGQQLCTACGTVADDKHPILDISECVEREAGYELQNLREESVKQQAIHKPAEVHSPGSSQCDHEDGRKGMVESFFCQGLARRQGRKERKRTADFKEEERDPQFSLLVDAEQHGVQPHPVIQLIMEAYQKVAFCLVWQKMVVENEGGFILAHSAGEEVMLTAISFLERYILFQKEKGNKARPLVLAPQEKIEHWKDDFSIWTDDLGGGKNRIAIHVLKERRKNKEVISTWYDGGGVLLVSYDLFENLINSGDGHGGKVLEGPQVAVLDEAHHITNKDSSLVDALQQLQTRKKLLLTGASHQHNLAEFFSLLCLADPDGLKKGVSPPVPPGKAHVSKPYECVSDRQHYTKQKGCALRHMEKCMVETPDEDRDLKAWLREEIVESIEEGISLPKFVPEITRLLRAMQRIVHYTDGREDETEVPKLTVTTVFLPMSPMQEGLYKQYMDKHVHEPMKGKTLDCIMNLLVHPFILTYRNAKEGMPTPSLLSPEKISSKMELPLGAKAHLVLELLRTCSANRERVLLFSKYNAPLQFLAVTVESVLGWKENQDFVRLHHRENHSERAQKFSRLNATGETGIKLCMATAGSFRDGLQAFGASRLILLSPEWNALIESQGFQGLRLKGQRRPMHVYRLIAKDTLEEDIHESALQKQMVVDMLWINEWSRSHGYAGSKHLQEMHSSSIKAAAVGHEADALLKEALSQVDCGKTDIHVQRGGDLLGIAELLGILRKSRTIRLSQLGSARRGVLSDRQETTTDFCQDEGNHTPQALRRELERPEIESQGGHLSRRRLELHADPPQKLHKGVPDEAQPKMLPASGQDARVLEKPSSGSHMEDNVPAASVSQPIQHVLMQRPSPAETDESLDGPSNLVSPSSTCLVEQSSRFVLPDLNKETADQNRGFGLPDLNEAMAVQDQCRGFVLPDLNEAMAVQEQCIGLVLPDLNPNLNDAMDAQYLCRGLVLPGLNELKKAMAFQEQCRGLVLPDLNELATSHEEDFSLP